MKIFTLLFILCLCLDVNADNATNSLSVQEMTDNANTALEAAQGFSTALHIQAVKASYYMLLENVSLAERGVVKAESTLILIRVVIESFEKFDELENSDKVKMFQEEIGATVDDFRFAINDLRTALEEYEKNS